MAYELRLYEDRVAAKAQAAPLPAGVRAVYVVEGAATLLAGEVFATLAANSGWHARPALTVRGGGAPSTLLRWELVRAASPEGTLGGQGVSSRRLLAAPMPLDPSAPYLLRCDRVDFPPGGEALLHTHQGGGIRCLLAGSIRIDSEGASHEYGPLEAWYEAGPDPVYAATSPSAPSAFARLMILPAALLGQSSIRYVRDADRDRPKSQRYQVFVDAPIRLP